MNDRLVCSPRQRAPALATLLRGMVVSLLTAIGCLAQAAPFDANSATRAELESIKGVGPSISDGILEERRKRAFADWQDLIARVKGVGEGSAAKFSADGLTVNGVSYRAPSAMRKAGQAQTHPATRGQAAPTPAASAQQ